IATLKATADLVGQKTVALEAQREAVDRALAQAEALDRAMRQIDAGVRQQQENERSLTTLHEQIAATRSLHEEVVDRSSSITQLQREIDDRTEAARQELTSAADETRKTLERFDFERRGIESVTQRVADLRAALADCESRFKVLKEPSLAGGDLQSRAELLAVQFQKLGAEADGIEGEIAKLPALRRELDETGLAAREAGSQMSWIREARPAVEAALRDLEQLRGADIAVKDAL